MPADLIIIAAIAVFILLRLRSVLGQKPGDMPNPMREINPEREKVVQIAPREPMMQDAEIAEEDLSLDDTKWPEAVRDGIADIRKLDKQFTMTSFMEGANIAFDMVHDAFAKGDRETLKGLMSKDVFALFKQELDARASQDEYGVATLIAITKAEPKSASVKGSKASVTVHFVSEQIQSRRDKKNTVVAGGTSAIQHIEDEWTFERDLRSANPNWVVSDT